MGHRSGNRKAENHHRTTNKDPFFDDPSSGCRRHTLAGGQFTPGIELISCDL